MEQLVSALTVRCVAFCVRRSWLILVAVLAGTIAAGGFAASMLRLEPDETRLIDHDVQFLQNYDAYKAAYLQHWRLNIVVIDGPDARTVREVEGKMLDRIEALPDLFRQVVAPARNEFVARHALLYLPVETLQRVVDRLSAAQPALAAMAGDPSLRGLARLFDSAVGQADGSGEAQARLAGAVADTAAAVARDGGGEARPVSWTEVVLGPELAPHRRIIIYQGGRDESDLQVSRRQEHEVRQMAAQLAPRGSGVTIRMTGRGPLSADELESALDSVQLAGLISLVFVILLLWVGVGSLRAIAAAVATLLVGLVATGAFAAATIGSLNVLSMTFAVLFVGLGIDFAIHIILRLREEEAQSAPAEAWLATARGAGPTIALCGLTTAIAFLSFWPTEYRGLAELGIISAGGMAIAVVASFTVLPALLHVMGADRADARRKIPSAARLPGQDRVGRFVLAHARLLAVAGLATTLVAAGVGVQVPFDFNTLNMQDPEGESVRTLLDLQADGTITPYTLTVRVPDVAAAEAAAARLRQLDSVAEVKTLADYVPDRQDDKLAMIDELAILLGPAILSAAPAPPPGDEARLAAVDALAARAAALAEGGADAYAGMAASLRALADGPAAAARAQRLEALLAGDFVASLETLRAAVDAGPVTLDNLPREIIEQESGSDGTVRVVATPREDLRDFEALGRFVHEVTALYPAATGRPALEEGVGRVVVDAFRDAFLLSAVAIFAILLLMLRNLREAALVMTPLLLAAALTAATMVILGLPLNVANVIVLPLLLGIGVDSGIHLIGRFRERGSIDAVFASSTPRAVVVSALTTLASFVALAFSSHRGMASMGTLLAISIGFMLVCALIVLPALLAWNAGARAPDRPGDVGGGLS